MLCRLSLAVVVAVIAYTPSLAQTAAPAPPFGGYQGSAEEQKACQPAVFKFCRDAVPDTFRILQCLQRNRPKIGKACEHVLSSHGQ
jgi:hypothetical protein